MKKWSVFKASKLRQPSYQGMKLEETERIRKFQVTEEKKKLDINLQHFVKLSK